VIAAYSRTGTQFFDIAATTFFIAEINPDNNYGKLSMQHGNGSRHQSTRIHLRQAIHPTAELKNEKNDPLRGIRAKSGGTDRPNKSQWQFLSRPHDWQSRCHDRPGADALLHRAHPTTDRSHAYAPTALVG
jgi:hypothetical protein